MSFFKGKSSMVIAENPSYQKEAICAEQVLRSSMLMYTSDQQGKQL